MTVMVIEVIVTESFIQNSWTSVELNFWSAVLPIVAPECLLLLLY